MARSGVGHRNEAVMRGLWIPSMKRQELLSDTRNSDVSSHRFHDGHDPTRTRNRHAVRVVERKVAKRAASLLLHAWEIRMVAHGVGDNGNSAICRNRNLVGIVEGEVPQSAASLL